VIEVMDLGSFAWGVLVGIGVGVILFTATGREVARAGAGVAVSTGKRLEREISK
jgi:hypothetical protein